MRISISKISLFKSCRRAYELKYIEGLEPIRKSEALQIGTNYHEKLERINKGEDFDEQDLSKESAMAFAYKKYIAPKFNVTDAEVWVETPVLGKHTLVGIVDGITDDDSLVEYKTTSDTNLDEYEYSLEWDEQILTYMLLTGKRHIHYVVCRKPNIRQRKYETDEEFFKRMCKWFDEDTNNKIRLIEVTRTDEQVLDFRKDIEKMVEEMSRAEENKLFYRNTGYCWKWGRQCDYAPVCLHYDPNEKYIEFERSW